VQFFAQQRDEREINVWSGGGGQQGRTMRQCERERIWTRVERGSDSDLDVCESWGTRGNGEGRQRKA